MAVTSAGDGSQTTSGTTEHTLLDIAAAGTYILDVDLDDMVAGDVLELRVYKIVRTGGTRRVAYYQRYEGVQPVDDKIKISVPISNVLTDSGSLRFTCKATFGTVTVPWQVLKL